ncbi:spidroin-2-like [Ornithodoros turicata]|uniref:spidroin-2-like n=1 Tax=Ornithodoros turicata TaxID=34597 RepID=UPI0031391F20
MSGPPPYAPYGSPPGYDAAAQGNPPYPPPPAGFQPGVLTTGPQYPGDDGFAPPGPGSAPPPIGFRSPEPGFIGQDTSLGRFAPYSTPLPPVGQQVLTPAYGGERPSTYGTTYSASGNQYGTSFAPGSASLRPSTSQSGLGGVQPGPYGTGYSAPGSQYNYQPSAPSGASLRQAPPADYGGVRPSTYGTGYSATSTQYGTPSAGPASLRPAVPGQTGMQYAGGTSAGYNAGSQSNIRGGPPQQRGPYQQRQ